METAILVPVLARPHRVQPLLESLDAATPEPHRVLFICDVDDTAELRAVRAAARGRPNVAWITVDEPRNYAAKINAGYRATASPLLFIAADDLAFHAGWLAAAIGALTDTTHVVGTNDLFNPRVLRGDHSTHTLVTRDYVERFGTIDEPGKVLHERYPHEYVDDEFIGTAKKRRAYAHAHDSIVEHLHPYAGKADLDATYERGRSRRHEGLMIYRRRRHLWR